MKTDILEFKERDELQKALIDMIVEEIAIVNISFFFDQFTETHKAVVCYYE